MNDKSMELIVSIIKYKKIFPDMTIKLFKTKRKLFEILKYAIMLNEFKYGFIASKWNKPTNKGISAKFKPCNKNNYQSELEKLKAIWLDIKDT